MRVCPHTCDSFLVQGSFHYGGISLTNHTEIFCKQNENALSSITEMLFWSHRNRDSKEERSSSTAEVAGGSFPARLTAGRQGWGRPAVDIQTCALSSQEVLISTQWNLTQRIIIHSSIREKDRSTLMYWVIFTSAWITEKQNVLVKCQPWACWTIFQKFKVHIFDLKQSTTGSREDPVLWKNNGKWRVSTKYRIYVLFYSFGPEY